MVGDFIKTKKITVSIAAHKNKLKSKNIIIP